MNYSKIPLAQTITTLCKAYRIEHIIISPGSRNAPLTIGFTHNNFFSCYSIVDERCAAFFALGMAQQLQHPVALVCTSGSALLNYYPAISEAFYSNIPLVVLSADRPDFLVDIGDGQTIKQQNVYGSHVNYSTSLKLDHRKDAKHWSMQVSSLNNNLGEQPYIQSFNEAEIHKALKISVLQSSPVHINVPFDEPLYDRSEKLSVKPVAKINSKVVDEFSENDIARCIDIWNNASRKLILVGVLPPNEIEQRWLELLAKDNSVIVLTETTSNIHHKDVFSAIDQLISPLNKTGFTALQPSILLTIGGMLISKKVKVFLRNYTPKYHWHVGLHEANDTFFCLEKHFKCSPNMFLKNFLPQVKIQPYNNYKPQWLEVRDYRIKKHSEYLDSIAYSDFKVFHILLKSIPADSQLQVGNSSAIRYAQLFKLRKDSEVFCNRGTSGIDGSTSTAIGAAVISQKPVILITGDLSFFYDSNALWNNYIASSFRIIVVNNAGGGIFRILPGHKNTDNFDKFFETKHQLRAENLCKLFGFDYCKARSYKSLNDELQQFYKPSKQPKLLEIFTPSTKNDEVLLKYFEYIS